MGKVRDGDLIRVVVDCRGLEGSVDLVGDSQRTFSPEEGGAILASRASHPALAPHAALPDDTRIWALLQQAGGGTWGGCVFDAEAIARRFGLPG